MNQGVDFTPLQLTNLMSTGCLFLYRHKERKLLWGAQPSNLQPVVLRGVRSALSSSKWVLLLMCAWMKGLKGFEVRVQRDLSGATLKVDVIIAQKGPRRELVAMTTVSHQSVCSTRDHCW